MGDPTPSDRLGIGRRFDDLTRRVRNLEKTIRRRLTVASLFASGDVNAAGNVTGSTVASYSGITGLFLTVALAVKGLTGEFTNGVKSPGVRTTTLTNSPVQLYVDADGNLGVSASTLAKKNVGSDYAVDMQKFLNVTLKNWTYKDKPFATGMGPIADDLDAAGLKEFVLYNIDGSIQGVRSDMLIIGLWSAYVQSRTSTLTEFNKRLKQTKTVTNMTALSIGGTKSYTIMWDKPFTDTDYAVTANVYSSAGALLSGATAASLPSSRTTTQCVVQVTAGVALLAGQTLVVEAIHV